MGEVRKASSLKKLEELKVSGTTRDYLTKNFYSLEEVVKRGRVAAARMGNSLSESIFKTPRWELELVSALRKNGFIRPTEEFTMMFNLGSLYRAVFFRLFIVEIEQVPNELYEEFKGLRDEVKWVIMSLRGRLTEDEFEMICYHFGLDGENARNLNCVGEHFGMSRESARLREVGTIRKLQEQNTLPPIKAIALF